MSDINCKRMTFVGRFEDIDIYRYTPVLFKPYYMDYPIGDHPYYEKHFVHNIRMMLELLRGGYSVYYMVTDGEIAGHIVVASGGRRLAISKKEDIVLGPIYVAERMRGRGFATVGIRAILNEMNLKYRYAYEFILESNTASIRTVEKNGYKCVGRAKEKGPLKNLIECPDGDFVIYCYTRDK